MFGIKTDSKAHLLDFEDLLLIMQMLAAYGCIGISEKKSITMPKDKFGL